MRKSGRDLVGAAARRGGVAGWDQKALVGDEHHGHALAGERRQPRLTSTRDRGHYAASAAAPARSTSKSTRLTKGSKPTTLGASATKLESAFTS